MTPKGSGLAHVLIDYGIEANLMWTVFLDSNGECWTFGNPQIRACQNVSANRIIKKEANNEKNTLDKCS